MEGILWYWGPTILIAAAVLIVCRAGIARQGKYFKTQTDNTAAQTAELSKIHRTLERVAVALEGRNSN